MLRTHNCGELNEDLIAKEVVLCGWVDSRRDHGKIIFIDIRDRYGLTQIVFVKSVCSESYQKAQQLKNEDVVKIKGRVGTRPKGTINPNISTGRVEVCVESLDVLNQSEELPFPLEDRIEVSEEIRLTYRFLDLRRKRMAENIKTRAEVVRAMRSFFDKEDFLEVETPFLTKSTPEGARDFLVPSRIISPAFYALPQSPQLFKQILMVSGLDRYYQIVRCFRDEDLRRDRQPEFTQLDLEMSFIQEEDIYSLIENMLFVVFKSVLGLELEIPFKRLTYCQAQEKYNTDKPDIKGDNKFRFVWVTHFPLFHYNQEENRWDSEHHPFTAPLEEDLDKLEEDPSKVRSRSYDLVLNGEEIGSGSIRIHSASLQSKIFNLLNLDENQAKEKFGFLLEALGYGAPPHGGFALGLDRFLSIIRGTQSLRDVIAFPKTQRGYCPLSRAPSEVSQAQLKELNIKTVEKED
jgi:aspartyl-tRNA synthetase